MASFYRKESPPESSLKATGKDLGETDDKADFLPSRKLHLHEDEGLKNALILAFSSPGFPEQPALETAGDNEQLWKRSGKGEEARGKGL